MGEEWTDVAEEWTDVAAMTRTVRLGSVRWSGVE